TRPREQTEYRTEARSCGTADGQRNGREREGRHADRAADCRPEIECERHQANGRREHGDKSHDGSPVMTKWNAPVTIRATPSANMAVRRRMVRGRSSART